MCVTHILNRNNYNVRESFWPIIAHAFLGIFCWTKGLSCILNYNIKKLTYCTSSNYSNIIVHSKTCFVWNLCLFFLVSYQINQLPLWSSITIHGRKQEVGQVWLIDKQRKWLFRKNQSSEFCLHGSPDFGK